MFCHYSVVATIITQFLILTFPSASALSSVGDSSSRQYRRGHDNLRPHHPKHPSVNGITADYNDGIKLAIGPSCGVLSASAWAGELNTGIDWEKIQ